MCLCSYSFQGLDLNQMNKKESYLINKRYTKKPSQNIENKFQPLKLSEMSNAYKWVLNFTATCTSILPIHPKLSVRVNIYVEKCGKLFFGGFQFTTTGRRVCVCAHNEH